MKIVYTSHSLINFLQQNYDKTFLSQVYSYPVVTFEELRRGNVVTKNEPVRIQYNTKDQYKRTAKLLGLMDDFKVRFFLKLKFASSSTPNS